MAPQPRVAPPPPPPVIVPMSPGTQPGAPASVAPRNAPAAGSDTIKSPENNSPLPQDRAPATTGGGTIKSLDNNSPLPRDRARPPTGGTTGPAAPVAAPVDRSVVLGSSSRGLLPARNVAVVSKDGSGGTGRQVRTNEKGQFSLGQLTPGVRDVTFAVGDLQRSLPGTGEKKRFPRVTVSLLIPATPGGGARGNLIMHTYSRVDPNKDIRTKITVPKDGGGAVVDWGDGSPPVNVVRDGLPIDVGGRGPVDTIGKISFVPKFQKMQFFSPPPPPCEPWWQCMPPEDPEPPMDDPWKEVLPEIDILPPIDTIIEIVDDSPDPYDPPLNPPKIDEKGTFEIGSLTGGFRQIKFTLPQTGKFLTEPPKPPVKVALLLPAEPRAALQAMNAGGRPPRVGESDRLLLVEHIYAPDTTGQTLRVTITMAKDGNGVVVDWGDGTPVTNVRRDGKPVSAASVDHEAIGRILFVGAKKKQP